jgi:hypothetical protein
LAAAITKRTRHACTSGRTLHEWENDEQGFAT